MKLLVDTCVSAKACAFLRARGHDVLYGAELSPDPGDAVLLSRAHDEARVVVTLDKDFGELAVLHRLPHHGILRLVGVMADDQGRICALIVESSLGEDLQAGSIIVAEPDRIRIRAPN